MHTPISLRTATNKFWYPKVTTIVRMVRKANTRFPQIISCLVLHFANETVWTDTAPPCSRHTKYRVFHRVAMIQD